MTAEQLICLTLGEAEDMYGKPYDREEDETL